MAFVDVQLPTDVERGAQGGPQFNTTVITLSSGAEKRNINWQTTRGQWDVGYGVQHKEDFNTIIDFFYARQGMAHSFRFKDWTDFEIGSQTDASTRQNIGTGTGSLDTFQIFKRYTSGAVNFDRDISKPVGTTLQVYVNAVLQTITTHYTVDLLTGIITFVTPPPNTELVDVVTEFDVPVRFDTDQLQITALTFEAGTIPTIPVVEVRGE